MFRNLAKSIICGITPLLALCLFCGVKAEAGIAIATTSCNLSSTLFAVGNNNAWPNFASLADIDVTATPGYTNYFTPSASTDVCQGVMIWSFRVPTTTTTLIVNLSSGSAGTIWIATSTVQFYRNTPSEINGSNPGAFLCMFQNPVAYGDTTANQWRFRFRTDNGQTMELLQNAASQIAYIEVLKSTKSIVSGDSLFVTGYCASSGTVVRSTVSVDISTTLGTSTYEAVQIGGGGVLDFGDVQTASNTITCANNFRVWASYPSQFGLRMGDSSNRLTRAYNQKILFQSVGSSRYGLLGSINDGNVRQYLSHPARISVYGSTQSIKSMLAQAVTTSSNTAVLVDDMELTTGTTVCFGATTASGKVESFAISGYDRATKTITLPSNFANAHSTMASVYNMASNAVIGSISSAGMSEINYYGRFDIPSTRGHFEMSYVECPYVSQIYMLGPDLTTNINNIRAYGNNVGSKTGSSVEQVGVTSCTWLSSVTPVPGVDAKMYSHYFLNNSGSASDFTPNSRNLVTDSIFDGWRFNLNGSNGVKCYRTKVIGGNTGSFYPGSASTYDNYFEDVEGGYIIAPTNFLNLSNTLLQQLTFINASINEAITGMLSALPTHLPGTYIKFQQFDMTPNDNRYYTERGLMSTSGAGLSDTTTKNSGEYSLRFEPWTSHLNTAENHYYDFKFAVPANAEITVYGYLRRNSSYGSTDLPYAKLTSADSVISTSYTMTGADSQWEFFSVADQVGSTSTFCTLRLGCPTTTSGAVSYFGGGRLIVGDVTSGSATSFKIGTLWSNGEPQLEAFGPTVDSTYLQTACQNAINNSTSTIQYFVNSSTMIVHIDTTATQTNGYALTASTRVITSVTEAQITAGCTTALSLTPVTISTSSLTSGASYFWNYISTQPAAGLSMQSEIRKIKNALIKDGIRP